MREAVSIVLGELESSGANEVHTEPVSVFAWNEAPSVLELVSPRQRSYESVQHVHSASRRILAPLVDVGSGTEADLDRWKDRIPGAILLLRGHEVNGGRFVPIQIRVARACDRGAGGILVRNMVPGTGPAIELTGINRDTPIPVVGVSWEDAAELSAIASKGEALLKLETSGMSATGECVNTIGDLGPTEDEAEIIVLSAHLDSFHTNPGSFDNLTGVVTLLEIARALAPLQDRFVRRLRLIVYTGEEYGFLGSRSYIATHRKELDRFRFVFNMDSLWSNTSEGIAVMWSSEMRNYIDEAFRGTSRTVDVRNFFCMSSDYLPYMLEGIACARPAGFEAFFPPYSHTRLDTPDKISPDWIPLNAMTHSQLLVRMLVDPQPLPATRKSKEEVSSLLAREEAMTLVQVYGFDF